MTPKTRSMEPTESGFYERPSELIARDLPGHTIRTEAGDYTIVVSEGFSGLPRKSMVADYQRKTRQAGELCVTNFRGWPQLNIVGKDASDKEQLIWLKAAEAKDTETEVTGARITSEIAKSRRSKKNVLEFAMDVLDGKHVRDTSGPLRIVNGHEDALHGRNRVFISHGKDSAKNSVGYGALSAFTVDMPKEELQKLITREAAKIKMTYEDIVTDPAKMAAAMELSPRLRRIIEQMENNGGH